MVDQGSEVGDILVNAALLGRTLAFAVAAPVVGENPKRLGQSRNDKVPVVVRPPRPVHEDQRNFHGAADFVVEPNPVYVRCCHAGSLSWHAYGAVHHPRIPAARDFTTAR